MRFHATRVGVWPWHPLLVAWLPVLEFYRVNFGSSHLRDALALATTYSLVIVLIGLLLRVLLGSTRRAAWAASALAFVLLRGGTWATGTLLFWSVVVLAGTVALRFVDNARLRRPTLGLNLVLGALVILCVARTLHAQLVVDAPEPRSVRGNTAGSASRLHPERDVAASASASASALALEPPDVYFIVADGLGSPEILEQRYGVPRARLKQPFEELGFRFVADSRSNYTQTALSLASTLNLDYLQNLLVVRDPRVRDRRPLGRLIADNRAVRTLRGYGYRVVSIPSGYELARLDDVDARLRPRVGLGFFAMHNLRNTILPSLQRLLGRGPADLGFGLHRRRLRTAWRDLSEARRRYGMDEPLFVFAHLIAPHPPFVYGRAGEPLRSTQRFAFRDGDHWQLEKPLDAPDYSELYGAQTEYVVAQLAAAVRTILNEASRPTIIVIQGDHGPGGSLVWDVPRESDAFERHSIFNAWYVPAAYGVELPEGMTSVNSFRVLLRACFGMPLERLEDRIFFARWSLPYAFLEVGTPQKPAPWASFTPQAAELP